ncbi:hypothetical protein M569_01436, partial [Genlisea aurea]
SIFLQVGHLGDRYDEWVHQPIVTKETPRFFHNALLELLTRTPWWVVPVVWLPVVWWFVTSSIEAGLTGPPHLAATMGVGMLIWTLLEYSLHRFVFHVKTRSYWGNTLHYLIHGCHHKHPMDGLRLVFPPAPAAILAFLLWNAVKVLSTEPYSSALFGGGLLGYVMYDCTHYYLHYGKPLKGFAHDLKRNHMNHHFRIQNKGFGITSNFWDWVFATLPQK